MNQQVRFLIFLFFSLLTAHKTVAHPGVGIVQDSKGNIFFTDLVHVWKISPDGGKSIAVKNVHTHELYLDNQDNLFGEHVRYEGEKTDRYHHRIWRRSSTGKVSDFIRERPGFREDIGFVRDPEGNQYFIQYRNKETFIRKRAANGNISTIQPDKPLGKVNWLAVSPDGKTIYATTSTGFYSLTKAGKVSSLLHKPEKEHHAFFGIWPEKDGSVFVADYAQNAIQKVAKNGQISIIAKTAPPWAPSGLSIGPDKTLWQLEYSTAHHARVRKITPQVKEQIF